jgi:hypothetical protein
MRYSVSEVSGGVRQFLIFFFFFGGWFGERDCGGRTSEFIGVYGLEDFYLLGLFVVGHFLMNRE